MHPGVFRSIRSHSKKQTKQDFRDTLEVLISHGHADLSSTDIFNMTVFDYFYGPIPVFKWLKKQEEYLFQNLTLKDVYDCILNRYEFISLHRNYVKLLRVLIPQGLISSLAGQAGPDHVEKTSQIIMKWVYYQVYAQSETDDANDFDDLVMELFAIKPDLFSKKSTQPAPTRFSRFHLWPITIYSLLKYLLSLPYRDMKQIVKRLLHIFEKAGVDLVEYEEIGSEYCTQKWPTRTWVVWEYDIVGYNYFCSFKLLDLKFGATPRELKITFEELYVSTELLVPFWISVEGYEEYDWNWHFDGCNNRFNNYNYSFDDKEEDKVMPGSWPEDERFFNTKAISFGNVVR